IDRLRRLAPWPVNFLDPAPAIARRVSDLLGPALSSGRAGTTRAIFTSGRTPAAALARFGSRNPAERGCRRNMSWGHGTGGTSDDRCSDNARLVFKPLGPAHSRRDRHDGDLQPAICVDAVYRASQPEARDDACGAAVDLFPPHHPADVVLAVPGLLGGPVRPAPADHDRGAAVRRQLDLIRLGQQPGSAL